MDYKEKSAGTIRYYSTSKLYSVLRIHSAAPENLPLLETCDLITTTGMLGYALRSLKKPYRIAAILLSILLWYGLSSMVFEIQIKGEKDESRKLIADTLKKMEVVPPVKSRDVSQLKTQLKKNLENDIAWLEIEKQGSRYLITYTPKEFASLSQLGHEELIAQEDGMIERFDIQHGNKLHKVNEFVHKGDVLVRIPRAASRRYMSRDVSLPMSGRISP